MDLPHANIIWTEFELSIVHPFLSNVMIKFYCRYVGDTLLLIKPGSVTTLLSKMHSDKNFRFTYDDFDKETPHFLDIQIEESGLSIY